MNEVGPCGCCWASECSASLVVRPTRMHCASSSHAGFDPALLLALLRASLAGGDVRWNYPGRPW